MCHYVYTMLTPPVSAASLPLSVFLHQPLALLKQQFKLHVMSVQRYTSHPHAGTSRRWLYGRCSPCRLYSQCIEWEARCLWSHFHCDETSPFLLGPVNLYWRTQPQSLRQTFRHLPMPAVKTGAAVHILSLTGTFRAIPLSKGGYFLWSTESTHIVDEIWV